MTDKAPDIDTLIGSAVYSFAKALIATGTEPATALRLTAFGMIDGILGREVTRTLGVPRSTMARWRQELAAAAEGADDVDELAITAEAMNALLPALGFRDLRMVQGADDEG